MSADHLLAGLTIINRPLTSPTDEVLAEKYPYIENPQTPNRQVVHAMAEELDIGSDLVRVHPGLAEYEGQRIYAATFLEAIGRSAHALIAHRGELIFCRKDTQIAWHARGFNEDSLGVEVLVPGVYDYGTFLQRIATPGWVAEAQLHTLVQLTKYWRSIWGYGTAPGELDRHSTLSPGRKSDPGRGFPWDRFVERASD